MEKVRIQNIKILQKRHTYDEWTNGINTKSGVVFEKLDKGELGFDLTNSVLKIGTNDNLSWTDAHEIGGSNNDNNTTISISHLYKVDDVYTTDKPLDTSNYFISSAALDNNVITYYYDLVMSSTTLIIDDGVLYNSSESISN